MGSLIVNSGKVASVGCADGLFNDRICVLVARRGGTWVLLHIAEGPDRSQIYQAAVEGDAQAAHDLMDRGKRGRPSSWVPARMTAIQAIELYLNALLLARGVKPAKIRGYRHNLRKRTANPAVSTLRLRQRTLEHLGKLSEGRECLSIRYGPGPRGGACRHMTSSCRPPRVPILVLAGSGGWANAAILPARPLRVPPVHRRA